VKKSADGPGRCDLLTSYLLAKTVVVEAGFEDEIAWQEMRRLDDVDEQIFLRECAWVVLSSGMRESVVRKVFPAIETAFGQWHSAAWVVANASDCRAQALKAFGHLGKISALLDIASFVAEHGVAELLEKVALGGPNALAILPFIGPATSHHLAKNLGLDVAKPDRHLVRVAEATGHATAHELCEALGRMVGDRTAVVDLVVWRFATINPNYVSFFLQQRCPGIGAAGSWLSGDAHGPRCQEQTGPFKAWQTEASN
jgi:hypothetical protein